MLANYYPYPGVAMHPGATQGLGTTDTSGTFGLPGWTWWALNFPLRVGAGWYLGRYFRHPVAGALLGAFLGVPGLAILAVASDSPQTALSNRRRRHGRRRHRRSQRRSRR